MSNNVTKLSKIETATMVDPVAEAAAVAASGIHNLREEVARLSAQVQMQERELAILESENGSLRAQYDLERTERAYYQRFSVEVATMLGTVGQICGDAVAKAQQAAYRKNNAPPGADLPELKIPEFLQKGPAVQSHEPAHDDELQAAR